MPEKGFEPFRIAALTRDGVEHLPDCGRYAGDQSPRQPTEGAAIMSAAATRTTTRDEQLLTAYFDMEDARRAAIRSHSDQDVDHWAETPADGVYDDAFEAFATLCTELGMSPDEGIAEARDVIGGRR